MNKIHTEETKRKISLALMGNIPWNKGKKMSPESRKKMSESKKLLYQNPEYRKKLSEAHKGCIPWNKGKKGLWKPTEEMTRKRLESRKGYKHSEETKRKISLGNKGKTRPLISEETRKKLRKAYKRRTQNQTHHWAYKNGQYKENGYILVQAPSHPCRKRNGYIRKHRLVIEKQIGRYLQPNEMSHHVNKIRDDNRPENLMAFKTRANHVNFEAGRQVDPSDIIFDGRKL